MSRLGGQKARQRLFDSLTKEPGLISSGLLGTGKLATGISDYFQKGPVGASSTRGGDVYSAVYGSDDDFLKRYSQFERKFHKAIDNEIGRIKGGKLTANLMKKTGSIDLNLLSLEASNALAAEFRDEVMNLGRLMQNVGLPSIEMPSANLYRHAFKFEIDNSAGVAHPVQVLLNSMILNFNPEREGISSLSLSRSNIVDTRTLRRTWEKFKDLNQQRVAGTITAAEFDKKMYSPFSDMKAGQKIIMFDTETTGVTKGSQVRSMAMREMEIGPSGEIIYDVKGSTLGAFDKSFDSPKLYGNNIKTLNGATLSLSELISRIEGGTLTEMGPGGKTFLDESTKFINKLMEADKIAGHNVFFDVDKIVQSMISQEGFGDHKAAQIAINAFLDRIQKEDYVVDTAIYARMYLQNQAQQLIGAVADDVDMEAGSKKFIETLMSQEILAKVQIGGSATYASVENIALNTNLFELIENDKQASELFDTLQRGSHIARNDVHLQSFISKYIQSGELKIREKVILEDGDIFTDFGRWARSVVARSSAVLPTTNIAHVQHLSQAAFDYVKSNGLTDVKLMLSTDDTTFAGMFDEMRRQNLIDANVRTGVLQVNDDGKKITFSFRGGEAKLEDPKFVEDVKTLIRQTLDEAAQPEIADRFVSSTAELSSKTVQRNRSAEKILDVGISVDQLSRATELFERGAVSILPLLADDEQNIQNLTSAVKSVYKNLGTGISATDQLRFLLGKDFGGSVFQSGIADFDFDTSRRIAEEFAKIGDPFANVLDMKSRVFSMIMANITSQTAQEAGDAARLAGVNSDLIAHTAHANLTSGLGVSYFRSQSVVRLFDLASDTGVTTSKPMVPLPVFREALRRSNLIDVGTSADKTIKASLSFVGEDRVNVVADLTKSQIERKEARTLAEKLFELMQDEDEIKRLTGKDEVAQRTTDQMATVRRIASQDSETVTKAIDDLTDFMMDRGIVIMTEEGDRASLIRGQVMAANEVIENDKLLSYAADVIFESGLTSEYGAVAPFLKDESIKIAGIESDQAAAREVVDINGEKLAKVLKVKGEMAGSIERTEGAAKRMTMELDRAKYGLPENKALTYYMTHKTSIKATALGVAAAGIGYYVAKKHRQDALYSETLSQQPIEANGQVRSMNENSRSSTPMPMNSMDPMVTAGVVGNLDRRKVGHTQMGKNKYNHLYGG